MKIEVIGNQVDKALNKLKHKLNQEGILKELKNRRYYEPKSIKKRRKREEARKRNIIFNKKFNGDGDNSFQTRYTKMLYKFYDQQKSEE